MTQNSQTYEVVIEIKNMLRTNGDEIINVLNRHEKEAVVFYTRIESNLSQIQKELRELQRGRAEDSKDIEHLKKQSEKHETRLSIVYGSLIVIAFLILVLFAN